ncbi:helix-turn-helix domain-containing protein [Roseivirga sp.]|uniref:helix-turn-helix domain-containing protein n=1 Tax=Roseivirga sp. TaxID=1964215 RepID=UPI002B273189|nr:helix-turn-helix domain-containing protein [Roseivirga sp.]
MENPFEVIIEKLESIERLLKQNKGGDEVTVTDKEIMNAIELADYLSISMSQLYKLTHNMEIPFYKPTGKHLYFKKSDIIEWVTKFRIKTDYELEQEAANHMRKIRRPRL